jgi:hypothetical protein
MIKFKFKRINQEVTSHYRPLVPAVGSTARLGYNADATIRSGQVVALPPAHRATSAQTASSTQGRRYRPLLEPALPG